MTRHLKGKQSPPTREALRHQALSDHLIKALQLIDIERVKAVMAIRGPAPTPATPRPPPSPLLHVKLGVSEEDAPKGGVDCYSLETVRGAAKALVISLADFLRDFEESSGFKDALGAFGDMHVTLQILPVITLRGGFEIVGSYPQVERKTTPFEIVATFSKSPLEGGIKNRRAVMTVGLQERIISGGQEPVTGLQAVQLTNEERPDTKLQSLVFGKSITPLVPKS